LKGHRFGETDGTRILLRWIICQGTYLAIEGSLDELKGSYLHARLATLDELDEVGLNQNVEDI